jgi:hypothetical protein
MKYRNWPIGERKTLRVAGGTKEVFHTVDESGALAALQLLVEDNAIDSFHLAKLQGAAIEFPLVVVELPRAAEISRGEGVVRIRDNGPGLTAELAEKALRAGYSGNRLYDSLGLFGMGFNISSGKPGRRTRFLTARKNQDHAIEVIVDLIVLQEKRSL